MSDSNLLQNFVLVSFIHVESMLPSIDNESSIKAAKKVLSDRESENPSTECILETLRLCSKYSNSVFNDKTFLQTDGKAQGPHLSCSCGNIAMVHFDNRAKNDIFKQTLRKRFREKTFPIWTHNINTLLAFLGFIDNIRKTKFTVQIADENNPELLGLNLR